MCSLLGNFLTPVFQFTIHPSAVSSLQFKPSNEFLNAMVTFVTWFLCKSAMSFPTIFVPSLYVQFLSYVFKYIKGVLHTVLSVNFEISGLRSHSGFVTSPNSALFPHIFVD